MPLLSNTLDKKEILKINFSVMEDELCQFLLLGL